MKSFLEMNCLSTQSYGWDHNLHYTKKCERVGVKNLMPSAEITSYLHKCVQKGKAVHYLPPYRPEHKLN